MREKKLKHKKKIMLPTIAWPALETPVVLRPTEEHTKVRKKVVEREKKRKIATCCLFNYCEACWASCCMQSSNPCERAGVIAYKEKQDEEEENLRERRRRRWRCSASSCRLASKHKRNKKKMRCSRMHAAATKDKEENAVIHP